MDFTAFMQEGKVIKGEKDIQKAKSLIKMSENMFKTIESIEITDVTASTIMSISYEALREIVEALCLTEGYKVYSHEAFTAYLLNLKEERISASFDRFRKLRNGINYYGKTVSPATSEQAQKDMRELCVILKEKYLKKVM